MIISDVKTAYAEMFKVPLPVERDSRAYKEAMETIGEKIIKSTTLWNTLFPNYKSIRKETSKRMQVNGVDFTIVDSHDDTYFIDLKCIIGDYHYDPNKVWNNSTEHPKIDPASNIQIPIELSQQKGGRTYKSNKKTDFLLYVICNPEGVYYYLISYKKVLEIVDSTIEKWVDSSYDWEKKEPIPAHFKRGNDCYKIYVSSNTENPGTYILQPVAANRLALNK